MGLGHTILENNRWGFAISNDVLPNRVVLCFMVLFIVLSGKKTQFYKKRVLWKNKAFAGLIVLASVLISINWFTFIFAVSVGHVMQASLGYYINPLVNVLLATVF